MSQFHSPIRSILFVCTGNIFRSLAAEQAMKVLLEPQTLYLVGSAGIDVKTQPVHEWVKAMLYLKGADPSRHVQRQVNREMVEAADLVIAMSRNHQAFIREQFGREVPLFNRVCFGCDKPIPDVHEVMPAWEEDLVLARAYVSSVIDTIWEATPMLISRLPFFYREQ
jgi:protein-tyrosine phosphatase